MISDLIGVLYFVFHYTIRRSVDRRNNVHTIKIFQINLFLLEMQCRSMELLPFGLFKVNMGLIASVSLKCRLNE